MITVAHNPGPVIWPGRRVALKETVAAFPIQEYKMESVVNMVRQESIAQCFWNISRFSTFLDLVGKWELSVWGWKHLSEWGRWKMLISHFSRKYWSGLYRGSKIPYSKCPFWFLKRQDQYSALQRQKAVTTFFRLISGFIVYVLSCDKVSLFNYAQFQWKYSVKCAVASKSK
jgi:hypothetical protein